jgi:hypothetical protein
MIHVGSIDYSPAYWTTNNAFILLNDELKAARQNQFERFWRVWSTEQSEHAPKLQSFTIILRAASSDGGTTIQKDGIQRFLQTLPYNLAPNITILLDNIVTLSTTHDLVLDGEQRVLCAKSVIVSHMPQ